MPPPAKPVPGQPTTPIISGQFTPADMQDPNLALFNTWKTSIENQVNALSGAAGKSVLPAGVDVAGGTVTGLGEPTSPADAVSKGHAEANYSASALAPQLESGGKTSLKSYRALNSKAQKESYSNFLEGVLNTSPTANTSIITGGAPSGGSVPVTVSAGTHLFVSGNQASYAQRTDTLALPASFHISSISRTGNVVTAILSAAPSLVAGDAVAVTGVTDTSYDGTFILTSAVGTTLVWTQVGADSTSSGGLISTNTCYYYYVVGGNTVLTLAGPFSSDTQQNRVTVNADGTVLIAVAVLNAAGLDTTQSAAGATPPTATGNARLLTRL